MKLTRRQKITIAVLVPYWIALAVFAHIPIPQLVYKAQVSDKWLHFLAYMNLVFLLWFSVSPDGKVSWRRWLAWLVFFVVVAYGGLDELLQPYVGRMGDIRDFLANIAGTSTGLIMLAFLTFWQALPAVLAITIFGLTNLAKANLSELVPIADALFHVIAYGCFTLAWVQFMVLYLPLKGAGARLLSAIGVPIAFLLIVKAGSLLLNRPFAIAPLLFSASAIVVVAIARELWIFRRQVFERYPVDGSR